jgi:hypothetical protein
MSTAAFRSRGAGAIKLRHVDFLVVGVAVALPAVAGFFVQRVGPVVLGSVCFWLLVGWADLERSDADLQIEGLAPLFVLTGLAGFAAVGAVIGTKARRRFQP